MTAAASQCPDEDALADYLAGELAAAECDRLESHVDVCTDCRQVVAELVRARIPDAVSSDVASGNRLGRFLVLDKLGAGAMGVVYLAYDPELDRKVAVKVLRHDVVASGDAVGARDHLLEEARTVAKLSHPNVIAIYDVGTFGDQVFLAMEHVAGTTLREWLDERPRSIAQIVRAFYDAGQGLSAAHEAGFVHRDFKPDNVLRSATGRVVVTDFGLARTVRPGSQPTRARSSAGTPAYMSPEQHALTTATPASDQFSFCVALYEALYRERPFSGDSLDALASNVRTGPDPTPPHGEVPRWLRRVVLQGLARDPARRFPTMRALLDELGRDRVRRRRTVIAAIATVVVVAVAIVVGRTTASPSATARCEDAAVALDEVWNPRTRAQIGTSFARSSLSYAMAAEAGVARGLDDFGARWRTARIEACTATARGVQSPSVLDLRMRCLDRQLARARAQIALFVTDSSTVEKAIDAIGLLPDPTRCADASVLADPSLPADPAERLRIARLEARLAELQAMSAVGRTREAIEAGAPVIEEIRSVGHPPLVASALFWFGVAQLPVDPTRAEATLFEAATKVAATANDRLAIEIWTMLVFVIGSRLDRHDEALMLARVVEVLLERVPDDPVLLADLLDARARTHLQAGDYRATTADLRRSLAIRERHPGPLGLGLAKTLYNLGATHNAQHEGADALDYVRRAYTIVVAARGEDHPVIVDVLTMRAVALREIGDTDQALETAERALAISLRVDGPDSIGHAVVLHKLGEVLVDRGDAQRALELHRAALVIRNGKLPPTHSYVAWSHVQIGTALSHLGRVAQAEAEFAQAIAIMSRPEVDDRLRSGLWQRLGEARNRAGDHAGARAVLSRALEIRASETVSPVQRADSQLELARAIWELGERARATELATAARDAFASARLPRGQRAAERFLADHAP